MATTSERVGEALDAYKAKNPGTTFNAEEVKAMIDGTEALDAKSKQPITSQQIQNGIATMVADRNQTHATVGVVKSAVVPAVYALDGGLNAMAGKQAVQAATSVAAEGAAIGGTSMGKALLGPGIGAAVVMVDAGIDVYKGNYKEAAISAGSGLASIAAAAGTGALLGSVVPGAGNVIGFIAGAAVGTAALLGTKWGLSKIFNDAASDETPAAAPVQNVSLAPNNNPAMNMMMAGL